MDTAAMVQSAQFQLVLQHMTNTQLQEYLDTDDRVETMVDGHEFVRLQKEQKEMVIVESQSLSAFNLSNESRLMEGRQKLLDLHTENRNARENYDRNKRKLDELGGKYSLAAAKKMLQTSATKKEDDAEDIASNFIEGEMTVDEFLQSFQICRLEAHLKRIKADKINELIDKVPNYENINIASPQPALPVRQPIAPPREPQRMSYPTSVYQSVPPSLPYDRPTPAPRGVAQGYPSYQHANGGIQYY